MNFSASGESLLGSSFGSLAVCSRSVANNGISTLRSDNGGTCTLMTFKR